MSLLYDIELYTQTAIRADSIDSRDLIKAREEAEELLADDAETVEGLEDRLGAGVELDASEYELLTDDERAHLEAIVAEVAELDGCCEDWAYGAHFIPEYRWTEYAEEYAADVYGYRDDGSWPLNHIDWKAAADELAQDYTTVEVDGESYYVR